MIVRTEHRQRHAARVDLPYKHVEAMISVDGLDMENKIFNINVGIGKSLI